MKICILIRVHTLIATVVLLTLNCYSQTLNFDWASKIGGTGQETSNSMAIGKSGNVYTTGFFNGMCDFDPSTSISNLVSAGNQDVFISKLDPLGNFIWAKRIGGANFDIGHSIAVDDSANVYITGEFQGTVDFDPGTGVFNMSSLSGNTFCFILKLDSLGNFVWAKKMGNSNGGCKGYAIAVSETGYVYTTGFFSGVCDFDPGVNVYNLPLGPVFLQKLDTAGIFIWAKQLKAGGAYFHLDSMENIYIPGAFAGITDFDPDTTSTFNLTSAGLTDICITKLDSSGILVWAKQMGGTSDEQAKSITVDNNGNVYTIGNFSGTSDFDPSNGIYNLTSLALAGSGSSDIFVSKLDASGNFLWAKAMGGGASDKGDGKSIAVDAFGNVYTTGNFIFILDFDPGAGVVNLNSGTNTAIFIQKLDSSGNFVWAKSFGGGTYNYFSGNCIKVDNLNNIYLTGTFVSTVDFDPSSGTFNLTSSGGYDIFVEKFNQNISVAINENKFSEKFISIYPNPFTNQTSINFIEEQKNITLKIIDVLGKAGKTINFTGKQLIIEKGEMEEGIYFVQIMDGDQSFVTKKIIIQ